MNKDINEIRRRQSFEWFRGESGSSYLCPRGSVDKSKVTEAELMTSCVDESFNPHND